MTTQNNDKRHFRPKRLTTQDIRDGCIYLTNGDEKETQVCVVNEELRQGIDFISKTEKSVTFFGSARTKPNDEFYLKAYRLAKRCSELRYTIVSGGGPGIMEAANKGANDAGGKSIGMTIQLPTEQETNHYVSDEIPFYYFFTRKVALTYSGEAYLYFPGGFGTFDELFNMLTLIQTDKIAHVPIILVCSEFWKPLETFFRENMLNPSHIDIDHNDLNLYTIMDDEDAIIEVIKNASIRKDD